MGHDRIVWATLADKLAIEATPMADRWQVTSVYQMLAQTARAHPDRPALSFQIKSGPADPAETLTWSTLLAQTTQTANLLRSLGIGPDDKVALMLPNCTEMAQCLVAGLTAGVACPINPLLEVAQIGALLRETGAKVLVTLAPFPKTDVAQKAHAAVALAPAVQTVLHVDLNRYLRPPLKWLVPLLRPRLTITHQARVLDLATERARQPTTLTFQEPPGDRVAANFHTGGTTGMPKIARHRQSGMVYNGMIPSLAVIFVDDVVLCPLPLFHVLAGYPVLMTCLASGAHLVLPTPQGYRGEGVMDNFWALIQRWRVTFMVTVPTAAAALMQRPVTSDVSTLKYALCGSAPLPVELFKRFETATGVRILEGYGMTEATCLVSINPPQGERKIGSVGLPIPYTQVAILDCAPDGTILRTCGVDEIGEICIASPGVFPGYAETHLAQGVFAANGHLRTGDLGRIDADGYVWITGRAKDLIIRGGHNIDPAMIEEALMAHASVAFVGAIGQPDAHAGEVPAAYVELTAGATATVADLVAHARAHVAEQAAVPRHIEVLAELPKTAVGKVFKPDLRKRAIIRVYAAALAEAGIDAGVEVVEDKTRGLVARVTPAGPVDPARIGAVLGAYPRPWDLAGG